MKPGPYSVRTLRPQHGAGAARVVVVHDRCHPRRGPAQLLDKAAAAGQAVGRRDQHDHDLPAGMAPAHKQMAHKAGPAVLIIHGPAHRAHGGHRRGDGFVQNRGLQKAPGRRQRQNPVRPRGVDARHRLPALLRKAGDGLVAVVKRVVRAQNRRDRRKAGEQRFGPALLGGELLRIRHAQLRAAAAAAGLQGAGGSCLGQVRHSLSTKRCAEGLRGVVYWK